MIRFVAIATLILAFCVQATGSSAPVPRSDREAGADPSNDGDARTGGQIQWIQLPDARLEICGLPWFRENAPLLWRLPKSAADDLPPRVRGLMRFSTGARLRFASDTSSLTVKLKASSLAERSSMSRIGTRGLDVYVDGSYWRSATVTREGEQELTFFQGAAPKPKQIVIYLPSFQEVTVSAVGVDAGAEVSAPAPFARRLPIVFYGSSVAQGSCAGRPAMSYEAILARRLNLDFVNLGFGGAGKAEPEVVRLVVGIEPCCYVFDLGKSYGMQPAEVYADMLRLVRAAHPDVPLVCMTPIFSTREFYDQDYAELSRYVRQVVVEAAGKMMHGGDGHTYLVDGLGLLGPADADGFQEGVHPNDLGFTRIADRLEPTLREALRLEAEENRGGTPPGLAK